MLYKRLGHRGPIVSTIGFGAWAIGGMNWGDTDDTVSLNALHNAVEQGVTLFDTADVYGFGHSEELLSQIIKDHGRENIVIATKVGNDFYYATDKDDEGYGAIKQTYTKKYIIEATEKSLIRATLSDAFHQAEFQFLIEYTKNINVLKEEQLFHNGYLAYLSMEHDTSISYFRKMIELNPENDLGYYFIAQNYTALGEDDNAIKYYTKTLELSPRFAEATYNLGVQYTKKGNEYSANRYLSRAAKLNHQKAKMLLGPF